MPFNLFQNAARFVGSLRVVILTEKPQASRPVFIHERPNTPHHCNFIIHRLRIITQLAQISVPANLQPALRRRTIIQSLFAFRPGEPPEYSSLEKIGEV